MKIVRRNKYSVRKALFEDLEIKESGSDIKLEIDFDDPGDFEETILILHAMTICTPGVVSFNIDDVKNLETYLEKEQSISLIEAELPILQPDKSFKNITLTLSGKDADLLRNIYAPILSGDDSIARQSGVDAIGDEPERFKIYQTIITAKNNSGYKNWKSAQPLIAAIPDNIVLFLLWIKSDLESEGKTGISKAFLGNIEAVLANTEKLKGDLSELSLKEARAYIQQIEKNKDQELEKFPIRERMLAIGLDEQTAKEKTNKLLLIADQLGGTRREDLLNYFSNVVPQVFSQTPNMEKSLYSSIDSFTLEDIFSDSEKNISGFKVGKNKINYENTAWQILTTQGGKLSIDTEVAGSSMQTNMGRGEMLLAICLKGGNAEGIGADVSATIEIDGKTRIMDIHVKSHLNNSSSQGPENSKKLWQSCLPYVINHYTFLTPKEKLIEIWGKMKNGPILKQLDELENISRQNKVDFASAIEIANRLMLHIHAASGDSAGKLEQTTKPFATAARGKKSNLQKIEESIISALKRSLTTAAAAVGDNHIHIARIQSNALMIGAGTNFNDRPKYVSPGPTTLLAKLEVGGADPVKNIIDRHQGKWQSIQSQKFIRLPKPEEIYNGLDSYLDVFEKTFEFDKDPKLKDRIQQLKELLNDAETAGVSKSHIIAGFKNIATLAKSADRIHVENNFIFADDLAEIPVGSIGTDFDDNTPIDPKYNLAIAMGINKKDHKYDFDRWDATKAKAREDIGSRIEDKPQSIGSKYNALRKGSVAPLKIPKRNYKQPDRVHSFAKFLMRDFNQPKEEDLTQANQTNKNEFWTTLKNKIDAHFAGDNFAPIRAEITDQVISDLKNDIETKNLEYGSEEMAKIISNKIIEIYNNKAKVSSDTWIAGYESNKNNIDQIINYWNQINDVKTENNIKKAWWSNYQAIDSEQTRLQEISNEIFEKIANDAIKNISFANYNKLKGKTTNQKEALLRKFIIKKYSIDKETIRTISNIAIDDLLFIANKKDQSPNKTFQDILTDFKAEVDRWEAAAENTELLRNPKGWDFRKRQSQTRKRDNIINVAKQELENDGWKEWSYSADLKTKSFYEIKQLEIQIDGVRESIPGTEYYKLKINDDLEIFNITKPRKFNKAHILDLANELNISPLPKSGKAGVQAIKDKLGAAEDKNQIKQKIRDRIVSQRYLDVSDAKTIVLESKYSLKNILLEDCKAMILGDPIEQKGRMLDYGKGKSGSKEAKMTKAKLFRMAQKSQSLHDRLVDGDDLPEWVQDKITTAEDRLQSAYDYIEYKLHRMKTDGVKLTEARKRKLIKDMLKVI